MSEKPCGAYFFAFFENFFVPILTSGGPASFIMPLQIGKTPIVVPRQHQFNEHVNDHQVEFARNVAQRMGTIIPVEDINTLGDVIMNYDQIVAGMGHGMSSNNAKFNEELEKLVDELYCEENISSLSAILLDDDYYEFLKQGKVTVDGVTVLDAAYLIPFKAKAWMDLTDRKAAGEHVDSKNITPIKLPPTRRSASGQSKRPGGSSGPRTLRRSSTIG